jgi:Uma2 family endonuclease
MRMAQTTIAPPIIRTLADLRKRLGNIPLDRIRFHPAPGTATEKDVVEVEERENVSCELIDGTLVEKASGFDESQLAWKLGHLFGLYLNQNDLGTCVGADGMMRIAPGKVRYPNLAFLVWEKFPGGVVPDDPLPDIVPDLAVEVLSKGNTKPEMVRKIREYFEAGVRVVWIIDRKKRSARVYSAPGQSILVRDDQALDGGDVLPGLIVPLCDLFDSIRRRRKS